MVGVAVVFAEGCAANKQYRTDYRPNDPSLPPDPAAVVESYPDYKIGFVEFDDQGWFWDPKQERTVEKLVRDEAGLGTDHPSAVIMVLFAHGWKNNAAFDNGNVQTFRTVLQQLSGLEKALSKKENRPERKLIGVYAGWRGLSIKSDIFPPLGMETTIWARKNAAQRVGGYGAMTELLAALEALQKQSNKSLPASASQSRLIIVGHSLGADAVYNAMSQIITERFVDTIKQKPGELLKPVGDQVILLNPAFEAARFYDLEQLARSVRDYSTNQRPVVTVLQSKGDWATHDFFPIGQRIATAFQRHRSDFQKSANLHSVGWFEPFVTHDLEYDTNAIASPAASRPDAASHFRELRSEEKLSSAAENILSQRRIWRATHLATPTTNTFGNCILTSLPNYRARNPIVVVSVSTDIMKDHDDIGDPVLINFLQEYIPFCDNDPIPPP